jgi:tRNA uridine 5-carboxymethylaminomethyl modification enzyme
MKHVIEREPTIFVHQAEAVRLLRDKDRITGVISQFGETFDAKAVVICTGTFLRGLLHFGNRNYAGGRTGDPAAVELSLCLVNDLELEIGRLKTGTPPRVMAHTIDFQQMVAQPSDDSSHFSHWPDEVHPFRTIAPEDLPQRTCYMVKSTPETKRIVEENIDKSPISSRRAHLRKSFISTAFPPACRLMCSGRWCGRCRALSAPNCRAMPMRLSMMSSCRIS